MVPAAAPWLPRRSRDSARRETPHLRMQKPGRGRVWRGGDLNPTKIQLWDTRDRLSSFSWPVCKRAGEALHCDSGLFVRLRCPCCCLMCRVRYQRVGNRLSGILDLLEPVHRVCPWLCSAVQFLLSHSQAVGFLGFSCVGSRVGLGRITRIISSGYDVILSESTC